MNNYEIADHFALLGKLMDIHGENSFKAKSYSSAAFTIEKLPKEIVNMDDAELFGVRGIGEAIGKKIRDLVQTGKLPLLEKILADTPAGILEMISIKGLGPKKVAVIWKELGIESLGELEYACNENRIAAAKGFGTKTQDNILQSIAYYKQNQGFHLWAEVIETANGLVKQLQQNFSGNRFSLTGDISRQMDVIEYVEIVGDISKELFIQSLKDVAEITIEDAGDYVMATIPQQPKLKYYSSEPDAFYNALFTTTGSEVFVNAFTSQYEMPPDIEIEDDIFEINGLQYIPPALRESAAVLQTAANNELPDLIQPEDIKGIIHSHSTWSDGMNTLEQMAQAAKDKGLEYLVISDHSQAAFYANGLSPERIAAQHQEIDALNSKLAPFKIFKSIEADILNDGSLDYNSNVLSTFDLVIASVHSNLKMSQEKAMDRILAAVRNPFTTILGHPTGRLLLSRKGYPVDHKALIDACAEHKVVIEINAHPRRLDIDWRWISYALDKGVLLSIDPDAHSIHGFKDTYYGVMVAQKAGLTAAQNLSSFSLQEFEVFLEGYKKKRSIVSLDLQA